MYWVYEKSNDELIPKQSFNTQQEAAKWADDMKRQWQYYQGVEKHYQVNYFKEAVYSN
ncbi:MAG: hypothetical protein WC404_04895 [Candidatus Omnitrophota bacterium]|jgi:hypothetical protein